MWRHSNIWRNRLALMGVLFFVTLPVSFGGLKCEWALEVQNELSDLRRQTISWIRSQLSRLKIGEDQLVLELRERGFTVSIRHLYSENIMVSEVLALEEIFERQSPFRRFGVPIDGIDRIRVWYLRNLRDRVWPPEEFHWRLRATSATSHKTGSPFINLVYGNSQDIRAKTVAAALLIFRRHPTLKIGDMKPADAFRVRVSRALERWIGTGTEEIAKTAAALTAQGYHMTPVGLIRAIFSSSKGLRLVEFWALERLLLEKPFSMARSVPRFSPPQYWEGWVRQLDLGTIHETSVALGPYYKVGSGGTRRLVNAELKSVYLLQAMALAEAGKRRSPRPETAVPVGSQ